MNEVPLGFDWPTADIRLARTKEAIQIINKLWKREDSKKEGMIRNEKYKSEDDGSNNEGFVNFDGLHFRIKNARLYTPPSTTIPLYMAARICNLVSTSLSSDAIRRANLSTKSSNSTSGIAPLIHP